MKSRLRDGDDSFFILLKVLILDDALAYVLKYEVVA